MSDGPSILREQTSTLLFIAFGVCALFFIWLIGDRKEDLKGGEFRNKYVEYCSVSASQTHKCIDETERFHDECYLPELSTPRYDDYKLCMKRRMRYIYKSQREDPFK